MSHGQYFPRTKLILINTLSLVVVYASTECLHSKLPKMTFYDKLGKKCREQLNFEPCRTLLRLAKSAELDMTDAKFAEMMDDSDELKNLRGEFFYPKMKDLPQGKVNLSSRHQFKI